MPLSCDGAPSNRWRIAWNAAGPFVVDTWATSFHNSDGTAILAHRVVGKHGSQCSTETGEVIMFDRQYAELVCAAANAGDLVRRVETCLHHRRRGQEEP